MGSPLAESAALVPVFQLAGASLLVLGAALILAGLGLRKLREWAWWLALIGAAGHVAWALLGIIFQSVPLSAASDAPSWGAWFLVAAPIPIIADLLARRRYFAGAGARSRFQISYVAAFAIAPIIIFSAGYAAYAPQLEDFAATVEEVSNTSPEFSSPQQGRVYPTGSRVEPEFSCSNTASREFLGFGLASCEAEVVTLDTATAGNRTYAVAAVDTNAKRFEHIFDYSVSDSYDGYFVGPVDFSTTDVIGVVGRDDPLGSELFSTLSVLDSGFPGMVWTHDGSSLILITPSPDSPEQSSIWVVDANTGQITRTDIPLTIHRLDQLRLSPDDKYVLATVALEGGDSKLVRVSIADGAPVNVAMTTEFGDFMPDGSIIYVQQDGEEGTLYLARPDEDTGSRSSGSEVRETFYGRQDEVFYQGPFPALITDSCVSADGGRIAFVGTDMYDGELFMARLENSQFQSRSLSLAGLSAYTLDGEHQLQYLGFGWGSGCEFLVANVMIDGIPWNHIVALNADERVTADTVLESIDGSYEITAAAAAPDGMSLAFVSEGGLEESGLYLARLDKPLA